MSSKLSLAIFAGAGVGGAEKAAILFAIELSQRGYRVIFLAEPGPRDQMFAHSNIERRNQPSTVADAVDFIRTERIDVLHQHVPGYDFYTPIYEALAQLGDRRPPLIETNVFGRLEDPAGDRWVDFRTFISRASAVQAYWRASRPMNAATLAKATVLAYPLAPLDRSVWARQRDTMRTELGVLPNEILILRFGRVSGKWLEDEVAVFQRARRRNSALRLLLMEPPENIWNDVQAGRWGEGILLHRVVSDFDRLAAIYAAGDLMLHMPNWGESFGYTIAEAMQFGLPVVTRSTTWCDNAQVELVEHGVTGFVCNSRGGAVESVLRLAQDAALRARLGAAGVERITELSDLKHETDLLEEIMAHVVHGAPLQKVAERNRDLLAFRSTFTALENRVVELDSPGLTLAYWQGFSYRTYRKIHGFGSVTKGALKKRLAKLKKRLKG